MTIIDVFSELVPWHFTPAGSLVDLVSWSIVECLTYAMLGLSQLESSIKLTEMW